MAFERSQSAARDHSLNAARPDRPLIVKCTFDRWNKRITFTSARNCTYSLLCQKVEQGFALAASSYSIAYKDDDGEITDITNEADLTEAIQYFQASVDDMPVSSAASILSGRSFGGRKITLRVHISVDYDGPSLSDTSSLASLDDYKHSNGSELSLTLPNAAHVPEFDDDSVTVSSRDPGRSPGLRPLMPPPDDQLTSLGSWDKPSMSDFGTESGSGYVHLSVPRPSDPSAVFERLRLEEAAAGSNSNISNLSQTDRGAEWLRDQNVRMNNALLGGAAPDDSVADSAENLSVDGLDGALALQQDTRGKWYYSYTSSSSSAPSQTQDSGYEEVQSDSIQVQDGAIDSRPTSMEMTFPHYNPLLPLPRASSDPSTSASRAVPKSTTSDPTPTPFPLRDYNGLAIDPSIPPEVLQFVTFSSPPAELTDCSACGAWLDSFRYVCSTCGEKTPRPKDMDDNTVLGKGKGRQGSTSVVDEHNPEHEHDSKLNPFTDQFAYPPPSHRSGSSSSGSSLTIHGAGAYPTAPSSSSTTVNYLHPKPLPSLPKVTSDKGYELCSSCIESAGVVHALEASETSNSPLTPLLPFPSPTLSSSSHFQRHHAPHAPHSPPARHSPHSPPAHANSRSHVHPHPLSPSPSHSPTDESAMSRWRRTAPKHKGHLRHAYIEKIWGAGGWTNVEQDDTHARTLLCSTCGTPVMYGRYKCASCPAFDLCQACYGQVHELHPAHAFLTVPDPPPSMSGAGSGSGSGSGREDGQGDGNGSVSDAELARIPMDDGLGEKSMVHPGVRCAHCMLEIVGARFHCAICDNLDICSNCESAGLPGNLDSSDGGHSSGHIMIKIPYPLETTEVLVASKHARHLWADRDEPKVVGRPRANSMDKSLYAQTVVDNGKSDVIHSPWSHRVPCNSCQKIIVGTRYQCASCPSLPTAYNLCAGCEPRSYSIHDPMHIFFKINRPLDRPIESPFPLLPTLYSRPAGPFNRMDVRNAREYLKELVHQSAYCDRCFESIIGEWFRCAYCAKDLCSDCERLDTHNNNHVFVVFKSLMNMTHLKQLIDLDNPERTPPILPYPVFLS